MTFLLDQDTPDELRYPLEALGHGVRHVRQVLDPQAKDPDILAHAHEKRWIVVTCNRDDFLGLAKTNPHSGIIILIRRHTRVAEKAALGSSAGHRRRKRAR